MNDKEIDYLDVDYLIMGTDTSGAIEEITAKVNEIIGVIREQQSQQPSPKETDE